MNELNVQLTPQQLDCNGTTLPQNLLPQALTVLVENASGATVNLPGGLDIEFVVDPGGVGSGAALLLSQYSLPSKPAQQPPVVDPVGVTGLDPAGGDPNGGTTVTISGWGFQDSGDATAVSFGGTPVAPGLFTVDSDSQITAVSPPLTSTTETVDVQVTIPSPPGTTTSAAGPWDQYTYNAPAPLDGGIPPIQAAASVGTNWIFLPTDLTAPGLFTAVPDPGDPTAGSLASGSSLVFEFSNVQVNLVPGFSTVTVTPADSTSTVSVAKQPQVLKIAAKPEIYRFTANPATLDPKYFPDHQTVLSWEASPASNCSLSWINTTTTVTSGGQPVTNKDGSSPPPWTAAPSRVGVDNWLPVVATLADDDTFALQPSRADPAQPLPVVVEAAEFSLPTAPQPPFSQFDLSWECFTGCWPYIVIGPGADCLLSLTDTNGNSLLEPSGAQTITLPDQGSASAAIIGNVTFELQFGGARIGNPPGPEQVRVQPVTITNPAMVSQSADPVTGVPEVTISWQANNATRFIVDGTDGTQLTFEPIISPGVVSSGESQVTVPLNNPAAGAVTFTITAEDKVTPAGDFPSVTVDAMPYAVELSYFTYSTSSVEAGEEVVFAWQVSLVTDVNLVVHRSYMWVDPWGGFDWYFLDDTLFSEHKSYPGYGVSFFVTPLGPQGAVQGPIMFDFAAVGYEGQTRSGTIYFGSGSPPTAIGQQNILEPMSGQIPVAPALTDPRSGGAPPHPRRPHGAPVEDWSGHASLTYEQGLSTDEAVPPPDDLVIGRAVWSFWSRPFETHYRRRWVNDRLHLLSWVLSFCTAQSHFGSTSLVTDDAGARLLVDRLGLPFDRVSTELERLKDADVRWWVLGKLYAYRQQEQPFLHVDSDAYLWKALPRQLMMAPIVVQNPEYAPVSGRTYYKPREFAASVLDNGGWLPSELRAYVGRGGAVAFCTGVFGGTDVDALRQYSTRAIEIIESQQNTPIWQTSGIGLSHEVFVEQYYLGAFCADLTERLGRRLTVRCLFGSMADAFDPPRARHAGFTHLLGPAKGSQDIERLVSDRVRQDYPEFFERCARVAIDGLG
jgi:hypothetical protein